MMKKTTTYPHVKWHESLIVRIMALCAILVLCLLGLVYEISFYYYHEVVTEMETRTQEVGNTFSLYLKDHPDPDLPEAEQQLRGSFRETEITVTPRTESTHVSPFVIEKNEAGQLEKVARIVITHEEGFFELELRAPLDPQAEIMRAFRNKYFAALAVVFIGALGLMIYLVARMLRPLTELSRSCARISSSGELQDVTTRNTSGEIRALEQTFNSMVASLREKETIETNLRQAQRLSAIGNLAAGVAHDVRNPLNAIKLLSSHAIDTLDNNDEAAPAVKHMQTIRKEVNRLEEIVAGFLSLARERELQPEPTRIDTLLEEAVRLVHNDAESRDVRLTTELRAGDTALMIDAKQFTRAILNVIINAMEVSTGGRVRVFSRLRDNLCEIEVRDDGSGMPKDVVERAFEPYFTTKNTGTGLGLSITRGIIEEHGGTISINSLEGQGTQVVITLPLEMNHDESANLSL